MSEDDRHREIIFGIAARFGGVLFDGDAMLAAEMVVILDKEGCAGHRRTRQLHALRSRRNRSRSA
jgi:hypothetical protein